MPGRFGQATELRKPLIYRLALAYNSQALLLAASLFRSICSASGCLVPMAERDHFAAVALEDLRT
jgi:hypothetical protein